MYKDNNMYTSQQTLPQKEQEHLKQIFITNYPKNPSLSPKYIPEKLK